MSDPAKMTVARLQRKKRSGEKITLLTAYDFPMAKFINDAGVDIVLVSDAVGTVGLGRPEAVSVSVEEMIYHTQAVVRAEPKALVVADMPFLSYQIDLSAAKLNAGRLIKDAGASAIKLEGGANIAATIEAIVAMDIPVMAHIGLTPQSLHRMGGFRVQGRMEEQAEKLLADARAVAAAGAFSVVLEGIPMQLAERITKELTIPTIGIGAGPSCDGQVLVIHDILGLCEKYSPKFVKQYVDLKPIIADAVTRYINDVKEGTFPTEGHSFS